MIYEQISSTFESLGDEWHELADSFRRLADIYPDQSQALEEEPDGLAWLCDHNPVTAQLRTPGLRQLALAQGYFFKARRNADLKSVIAIALGILQNHEQLRQRIERTFTHNLFPIPPDGGAAEGTEILDCRKNLRDLRTYILSKIQQLQEMTSAETTVSASLSGLRDTVDDIASYPVLTSELGISPSTGSSSAPGLGSPNTLQRAVDTAVRDVLGYVPRAKDTRSFIMALNESFQVNEVEGHTEVTWIQRSYTGQTNLGGSVTGAQASLYTRSKVALASALPLLDGLYPLLPDYDPQLANAARSIVYTELEEVVNELGMEGGPRVARVDQLFNSLFEITNPNPISNSPPNVAGGHLGYLEHVFGLLPDQVNDLDEEHNVTNFVAVRDYAKSIFESWKFFRDYWFGKDLGTRLVLLSRTLSVTAETVDEVNFAMDSVFVGPAERQVASFRDQDGRQVLVDDLLSWAAVFANEEAPRLIRDAGKRGAAAIIPTGTTLIRQLDVFIKQIPYDPELPAGLRHPRVMPPLRELRSYLQKIVELAQDINRPVLVS